MEDDYRGAVRFELELKGGTANKACYVVYNAVDRAEAIGSIVREHFRSKGVIVPGESGAGYVIPRGNPMQPDVEVKLRWLREGVSPTVRLLIEKVGIEPVVSALFAGTSGYLDRDELLSRIALAMSS
jgi:hypothetical protein